MMHPSHTYHLHTTLSDGQDTVSAMVAAAAAKGFEVIGISDHFGLRADGTEIFGMRKPAFDGYLRAVEAVRQSNPGIEVRLGLEIDYVPGAEALVAEFTRRAAFDYIIGSLHFLDEFPLDCRADFWEKLSPTQVDDMWRRYWLALRGMVETRAFDFLGHLDIPKKFNFRPQHEPVAEQAAALDAIAQAGLPIEINTGGWDKPCAEAYPSEALLRECCRRGIPIVISDDAHCVAELGRHFPVAADLVKRLGWRECCTFAGRRRGTLAL